MNNKWIHKVAGFLDILVGGGFLIFNVMLLLVAPVQPFFWPAILAVVGGVYAINRKGWPFALSGSISALLLILALLYWPNYIFNARTLIFVPIGIIAVILTLLSRKQFEPVAVPVSRLKRGRLSVISGVFIIASGVIQVGTSAVQTWPVLFGDTVISQFWIEGPFISPAEFFFNVPWPITGIIAIILGFISIFKPEKWNQAILGAIVALIPLLIIATSYLGSGTVSLVLFGFVGVAAAVLTGLSKKQW